MDLDLKTLAIFVKVAELQSFVRAAEALDITQSGVSNAVKRLESQLGVGLLMRTTRSVRLTEEGQTFFQRCRQVIEGLEQAVEEISRAREHPAGMLRVSLPASFGRSVIVPLMGEFQAQHQNVEVAISITDRYVSLVEEGIDVALRFGELQDSSLVARQLVGVHRRIVAAPDYLARCGTPHTIDDLAQHNCLPLTYHETDRVRAWTFLENGRARHFSPKGSMAFNDSHSLLTAVRACIGMAQIHDYYIDADVADGSLVRVLEAFAPPPDVISIVYPKTSHLAPRVRVFVDFLISACGSQRVRPASRNTVPASSAMSSKNLVAPIMGNDA